MGKRVADTAEKSPSGLDMGVENLGESVAEPQVGVGHDPGNACARPFVAVGGQTGHELGLADRSEVVRPVIPVGGVAFHEDGLDDPVT